MRNNRTGNFWQQTMNISTNKVVYYSIKPLKTNSVKIGKAADRQEAYENKLEKRATVSGVKRKSAQGINSASKAVQFPVAEKLPDGKHRFFYKYGVLVDRLSKNVMYVA